MSKPSSHNTNRPTDPTSDPASDSIRGAPSAALTDWLTSTLVQTGKAGRGAPTLQPLQTEASFRQFYRVQGASEPLVLMDSPPDKEQNPQFVAVARAFRTNEIYVPEIYAHHESAGWLLLSDLGSTHFIDAYHAGEHEQCLTAALTVLEQIAAVRDPAITTYTSTRLADELNIFRDWLVMRACQLALPDSLFNSASKLLLANAADQEQVCVHRDFHSKNLLIRPPTDNQQTNNQQVGVLDFQDALMGPRGYDLASLLHDCYWKFSDDVIDNLIARVPGASRRSIDLLAVQRQLKAIGIFARLASRDGKTSHLPHIASVLKNLCELCARYRELNALGTWLADTLTPAANRWVATMQANTTKASAAGTRDV